VVTRVVAVGSGLPIPVLTAADRLDDTGDPTGRR
jgi:hypothetical protein